MAGYHLMNSHKHDNDMHKSLSKIFGHFHCSSKKRDRLSIFSFSFRAQEDPKDQGDQEDHVVSQDAEVLEDPVAQEDKEGQEDLVDPEDQ